jgi:hypothetical protein
VATRDFTLGLLMVLYKLHILHCDCMIIGARDKWICKEATEGRAWQQVLNNNRISVIRFDNFRLSLSWERSDDLIRDSKT